MEHYTIALATAAGVVDQVFVLTRFEPGREDEVMYDVYSGGALLGSIYPAIGESGDLTWISDDMEDVDLVRRIGDEIERQDR